MNQPHNLHKFAEVMSEMVSDYKELIQGDIYKYINQYQNVNSTAKLKQARNLLDYIIKEREN